MPQSLFFMAFTFFGILLSMHTVSAEQQHRTIMNTANVSHCPKRLSFSGISPILKFSSDCQVFYSQLPWKPYIASTCSFAASVTSAQRCVLRGTGEIRKEYGAARESSLRQMQLFEKLLAEDPEDVDTLCSFAVYLQNEMQDYDRAAEMYKAALIADPCAARLICMEPYDKPKQNKKTGKRIGIQRPVVPRLAIGRITGKVFEGIVSQICFCCILRMH